MSGSDTVTRAITRDADKLMSQEGPFAITRTTSGLPTSYAETGFSLALGYDASTRTVQRTATAAARRCTASR